MNRKHRFHAVMLIVVAGLAILLNAIVAQRIHSAMVLDAQNIADHVITPAKRTITDNVIVGLILAVALQSVGFVLVFGRFIFGDKK